ncbi:HpcH/HpaI aldolase family protein [Oricola indica]|jgi:4-hydroxy-2-oxoheptanedioate aldolase|uniref:HpcH/HpaI aldolase family protein n=1 Tax=Oricola indica TaxID=2872591 RepID=UPI001CBB3A0E|nr:aldolase/citrate lyase family protein [Oricola indica]
MTSAKASQIKQKLRDGEIVYSAWLTFQSAAVAEVIAGTGFDVVLIDMEHTSMNLETLEASIAAMSRWDPVTIVRVPSHDRGMIKRVLDLGVDGIMVPMVMNAAQAREVVAATKYPPTGVRGYGPRRASNYFRNADYFEHANENTIVMVQIEHPDAAKNAQEIANVAGLDVLCLGPADLAVNCGYLHDPGHPTVQDAVDRVFSAARSAGIPVCMGRYEPASAQRELVEKGARFVIASDDLVVLRSGLENHLRDARAHIAGEPSGHEREETKPSY